MNDLSSGLALAFLPGLLCKHDGEGSGGPGGENQGRVGSVDTGRWIQLGVNFPLVEMAKGLVGGCLPLCFKFALLLCDVPLPQTSVKCATH